MAGCWPSVLVLCRRSYGAGPDRHAGPASRRPTTIWPLSWNNGSRLERERRWAEALSHYEDALRQHPQRPDLQQRVSLARAHYEVCRRYNDPSFATALTTLTERDALAIYDEVLLKVQSHYVA